MNFSDPAFLYIFLPFFFIGYILLKKSNFSLLISSLIFYFIGEGNFLLLMFLSILINYYFGQFISNAENKKRELALAIGVVSNLAILGYYKYFTFITESIFQLLNVPIIDWKLNIHLPLGISFFTFQGLSYLIDIYHKNHGPEKSFVRFATYISMFPQLIAGPIVRYSDIKKELSNRFTSSNCYYRGALIFIIGLAKKTLIADSLSITVDRVFSTSMTHLTSIEAWIGSIAYFFQIYFDFSGYSDMAIGIGLIIGFKFPENFNSPYQAISIQDFWRRWHITLSSWFRDYLYIPLGGSRGSKLSLYRNLVLVFLLCGLWHGANYTFILWGIYHGAFLVFERVSKFDNLKIPSLLKRFYTLSTVFVGWILFRSNNLEQASSMFTKLFDLSSFTIPNFLLINNFTYFILFMAVVFCFFSKVNYLQAIIEDKKYFKTVYFSSVIIFLLSLMSASTNTHQAFIYFRF